MIKAVIFDVDGVLLDSFEANLQFYQDLMIKTGYQPPTREGFIPLFHKSLHEGVELLTGSKSEAEIDRIVELGRTRAVKYPLELLNMPAGATETVRALADEYPLAIVTSRIRESVFEAPELAKLKGYFRVAVSYDDTANHKPHPEPLLHAAEKLGVEPAECVYIGDVENDVIAARAAGMKVIIYSKNDVPGADARTDLFTDLPKLITDL